MQVTTCTSCFKSIALITTCVMTVFKEIMNRNKIKSHYSNNLEKMNKNATISSAYNKKHNNILKPHSKLSTKDSTINFIQNEKISLRTELKKLKYKVSHLPIPLDPFKLLHAFNIPPQSHPSIICHTLINYKITKISFPNFHNFTFTIEKFYVCHVMHA